MKTYIYRLKNCYGDSRLTYIGKTIDPNTRLNQHKKTYGNQTEMIIIDEVDSILEEDWLPLETEWISTIKLTYYIPLNKNNGGGGTSGRQYPILAKNMNGKVIKWYPNIQHAAEELGTKQTNIKNAIKHKHQCSGFYWEEDIDVKWPDTLSSTVSVSPTYSKYDYRLITQHQAYSPKLYS